MSLILNCTIMQHFACEISKKFLGNYTPWPPGKRGRPPSPQSAQPWVKRGVAGETGFAVRDLAYMGIQDCQNRKLATLSYTNLTVPIFLSVFTFLSLWNKSTKHKHECMNSNLDRCRRLYAAFFFYRRIVRHVFGCALGLDLGAAHQYPLCDFLPVPSSKQSRAQTTSDAANHRPHRQTAIQFHLLDKNWND